MNCELCGASNAGLKAVVEGVAFSVCNSCSSHGRVVNTLKKPSFSKSSHSKPFLFEDLSSESVVDNVSKLLITARSKRNLDQKNFAKLLNEKESFIKNLESGKVSLALESAKKFGRILNLNLLEIKKESAVSQLASKSDSFTVGDFIKKKN